MTSSAGARHVALFLGDLGGGGAERIMVTLANGFAKRGLHVDMVLAHAYGPLLTELSSEVNVIDLRARGVVAAVPRLIGYLRRHRPDALLATLDHANVAAIVARNVARVPVRVFVRVASTLDVLEGRGARMAVLRRFVRWTYPRADAVIAVSEGVRDDLVARRVVEPERAEVVYNPVIAEDFDLKAAETFVHPFLPSTSPLIVAAGRLVPQKDFATLLRAFAREPLERGANLIILGEGPERHDLEGLIDSLGLSGRVDLPGFVANPFPYMRAADLFVLSSRFEGLPSVLIQALACGTPVVSTDCPSGPFEVLEGGRYGRLVPVGAVDAMAEAMIHTLDEPIPSAALRERGRRFAVSDSLDGYLRLMFGAA